MILIDVPQRSPEWFEARKGVFTASEVGKFVLGSTKRDTEAQYKLICKKLAEISGCEMAPNFENWAMKRGTELEPEARADYEEQTGNTVREVGLVLHDSRAFGCSPDGLVNRDEGGLEIKVPSPETHVRYLFDGGLPEEYEMQVHTQLAATGLPWWDFYAFCPGLPSLLVRVERSQLTADIEVALIRMHGEYRTYKARIAALWDEMIERRAANAERASA